MSLKGRPYHVRFLEVPGKKTVFLSIMMFGRANGYIEESFGLRLNGLKR